MKQLTVIFQPWVISLIFQFRIILWIKHMHEFDFARREGLVVSFKFFFSWQVKLQANACQLGSRGPIKLAVLHMEEAGTCATSQGLEEQITETVSVRTRFSKKSPPLEECWKNVHDTQVVTEYSRLFFFYWRTSRTARDQSSQVSQLTSHVQCRGDC